MRGGAYPLVVEVDATTNEEALKMLFGRHRTYHVVRRKKNNTVAREDNKPQSRGD